MGLISSSIITDVETTTTRGINLWISVEKEGLEAMSVVLYASF